LNSNVQFLEFETHAGERSLIAKGTLLAVKVITVPTANSLNSQRRYADNFDPYTMLKVERGASWEEVRRAYLSLSKIYHPDRYASVELPAEVRDYLSAMISRINAAYTALEDANTPGSEAGSERKAPIYASPQRS
jgi:preprotein translocase subunit Sec63